MPKPPRSPRSDRPSFPPRSPRSGQGPGFGPRGGSKFGGGRDFGGPRGASGPRGARPSSDRGPDDEGTFRNDAGTFIARGVRLVHEDADVVVVDKPPGIVTADPSRAANAAPNMRPSARVGETLFDLVKRHVRQTSNVRGTRRRVKDGEEGAASGDHPGRVWVIHRLDKEASGLVVFAKSSRAFESLKKEFSTKKAHRMYLALAEGVVGEAGFASTRQSMIEEDRGPTNFAPRRGTGAENSAGAERRLGPSVQPAVTHYRVIASAHDRSLLQVRLETGRKNQIRIHMKELGHPLVGDARFGARTNPIKRLGLHAAELGFTSPANNQTIRFSSPAPTNFYTSVGMDPPTVSKVLEQARPRAEGPEFGVPLRSRKDSADDTSWEGVAQWYDTLLEDKGNDHYEQVILPGVLSLLNVREGMRVLDLACGQGILCRRLKALGADVVGVDASESLIALARQRSPEIEYFAHDARRAGELEVAPADAVTCVMALANIDPISPALQGAAKLLKAGGTLVACMTHPAFRSAGETHWEWDHDRSRQYRRVDSYLSEVRREIQMHPGKAAAGTDSPTTPTFHRPIGAYVRALAEAGFKVDRLEEWCSERAASSGPRAGEENRARLEIPLFMAIRAVKA